MAYILLAQVILTTNDTIKNNIISNCSYGISLNSVYLNKILKNTIALSGNTGIFLEDSDANNISSNYLLNNTNGIYFRNKYLSEVGPYGFSGSNIIAGNLIQNNTNGVRLLYSEHNNINGNKFIHNTNGINAFLFNE